MEILNRTKQPKIFSINNVTLIKPSAYTLDNGIKCFAFSAGTQDLIKIQFAFYAGSSHQKKALSAFSANKLLTEGTTKFSSEEIANKVDYYGSYIELMAEKDMAYVSLYTLNKHIKSTLPLLEDIIKNSIFPEHELTIFLKNQKQEFITNSEKVNFIARAKFNEFIFGSEHPYGANAILSDFDKIKSSDLKSFHKANYHANNCFIVLAGSVNQEIIKTLNCSFGGTDWKLKTVQSSIKIPAIKTNEAKNYLIKKEKAVQSSVRIGKVLFNKTTKDYHGLQVLNTLFGGYFGSRLMMNIREDKGYTYGIGSAIISLHQSGYFFITSEVGVDVCSKAIEEIYKELKKIRTEKVKLSELTTVKNYMTGSFLRSIDGPFALAERFTSIYEYGLDYEYYENLFQTIKTITPTKITELAEQYLNENSMFELVVGNKK